MAASLLGGLVNNGWSADAISVADPDENKCRQLVQHWAIHAFSENSVAVTDADVVVLAVKPQQVQPVAREISPQLGGREVMILSVAAGVREPDISRWFGGDPAVVRAMPNTPALVGSGVTGLFANEQVSAGQRDLAEKILSAVGTTVWLESETQLDAVTAVSGSGPAYFLLLMELMEASGIELGLDADVARKLVIETALGAAKLAIESDALPAELRQRVTSPGGTTERAIRTMEMAGIASIIQSALTAARDRASEIGDELGDDA